jgi:hypothetical protein
MKRLLVVAAVVALVLAGIASASGPFLRISVRGSGKVTGIPGGRVCSATCSTPVRVGATVRLTARPAAGWKFAGWAGGCHGTKPTCVLRLKASVKLGATFTKLPAPAPPAPPPSGFTPGLLAGTWNGSWRNQTFGSTGSAQLVIAQPSATSFTFRFALGGNVFGCSTPPATSGEITQGTGPNHWSADGFSIQTSTGGGGSASISYDFKTGAMTGSGTSGCNPGITWTLAGTFSGSSFSGTVSISLPGGITATSTLTLAR